MQTLFVTQSSIRRNKNWRVFISWAASDAVSARDALALTLLKAGVEVFPEKNADFFDLDWNLEDAITAADCFILVPSVLIESGARALDREAYEKATQAGKKRIIWLPEDDTLGRDKWWNHLLYVSDENLLASNAPTAAQLFFDIESFLKPQAERIANAPRYDLTVIYNEMDLDNAEKYLSEIETELTVNRIVATPNLEYRESVLELALKSKLIVVYFKEAGDWATYFAQAFWKYAGGARSETPILVIGESEPRRNRFIQLAAPQLKCIVIEGAKAVAETQKTLKNLAEGTSITREKFCPYAGLRPFKEKDAIFFQGREKHVTEVISVLTAEKFVMVTGASGDGKSSLVYAGLIPSLKGGFLPSTFHRWAIVSLRPERDPLEALASAFALELRDMNKETLETALGYGFSALIDLYKSSTLYCDFSSDEWRRAAPEERRELRNNAANLLILVDQFEEFFTNVENFRDGVPSAKAQVTASLLVETVRLARAQNLPIYVVITMRSDYIGQCVTFKGLAELIGAGAFFVPRLSRDEIEHAIKSPANLNGNLMSRRLLQRLLNDLGGGGDRLPTLQHSLLQIWRNADEGAEEMDLIHYARVGGLSPDRLEEKDRPVFNAWFETLPKERKALYARPRLTNVLNRHANELYETAAEEFARSTRGALTKERAQEIIRLVFVCLTQIDQGRKVRNRMTGAEVLENINDEKFDLDALDKLLRPFRESGTNFISPYIEEYKLTGFSIEEDTILEITHESLIRNWERLSLWTEEEDKSVQTFYGVKMLLDQWLAGKQSARYLMSSGTYAYYADWYQSRHPNAAWLQRYAGYGVDIDSAENYLRNLRLYLTQSQNRLIRRRQALGVTFAAFVALSGLVVYYAIQTEKEKNDKLTQLEKLQTAKANVYLVQKQLAEEKTQNVLKDNDIEENRRLKAEQIAYISEQRRRIERGERLNAEEKQRYAKLLAELAISRLDTALRDREAAENAALKASRQATSALTTAEIAEKEKSQALEQRNQILIYQAKYISALSKEEVLRGAPALGVRLALEALPAQIARPDRPYTPEAETALYFAADALVNAPAKLTTLKGHKNKIVQSAFSSNGEWIATTSWDRTALIWNLKTGKIEHHLLHPHLIQRIDFSPDSRFLLSCAEDYNARIWDVSSGHLVATLHGHKASFTASAFSYDRIATGSMDYTVRLWTSTGQFLKSLNHHQAPITACAFSPNGAYLLTASEDKTVAVCHAQTGEVRFTLKGHTGPVRGAVFSPDGRYILTASDDRTAMLWETFTGRLLKTYSGHTGPVRTASFSPDGRLILTASADYTARVWNAQGENAAEIAILTEHNGPVTYAAFSPDGGRIVTSGADRIVRLWDADMYRLLALYPHQPADLHFPVFSPSGDKLALADPKKHEVYFVRVLKQGQALIEYVKTQLQAGVLTPEERSRYNLPQIRN